MGAAVSNQKIFEEKLVGNITERQNETVSSGGGEVIELMRIIKLR